MLELIYKTMDEESKPFWEGLKNNKLKIQYCNDCEKNIFYPRTYCPSCFIDNISWQNASGKGKIYSYTIVHRAFGEFEGEVPFVVALIDLDEGVRMMTRILGDCEQITIGKRVSVIFHKIESGCILPYFQLD